MPNRKNILTWIEALRSGRYPQATGALRTDDGWCCLGVACDLADPKGWRHIAGTGSWQHDRHNVMLLSYAALDWLGVDTPNPIVHTLADDKIKLSVLNDNRVPFTTIADLIEEQLLPDEPLDEPS